MSPMTPSRSDRSDYGKWAPRVCALLAAHQGYGVFLYCRDDLIFCNPDVPGAKPGPLRVPITIAVPSLSADTARTMLSLAKEVRDELRTNATSLLRRMFSTRFLRAQVCRCRRIASLRSAASSRRKRLNEIAFNITLLAASPDVSTTSEGHGRSNGGLSGGNAEAQYDIALHYFTGTAAVCHGRRLLNSTIFWMMQSALENHAPALAWLSEHGVVGDD